MSFDVVMAQAFDAASNRTSLSATINGVADFKNTYTFDALHRLTRLDQTGQLGGNAVAEKRIDLTYNALGQFDTIARYKDIDGGSTHEGAEEGAERGRSSFRGSGRGSGKGTQLFSGERKGDAADAALFGGRWGEGKNVVRTIFVT